MRKILLLFLLIHNLSISYSQIIRGTVYDNETKSKITYASIYFNGTFVGTTTDNNGNFELDISKHSSMPLTVSAIGYYSVTLSDLTSAKPFLVYLTPKVFELNEVVVNSKSHERERKSNMRLFRNEFLGSTINAQYCEILNEEDIKFLYDPDNDILKAFASKPILIDNKALGYKITYYLDKFEYYKKTKTFTFRGNIIFKEDTLSGDVQKYITERERAYYGSRMHFFRALWLNDLKPAGFTVKNSQDETLRYKDIVFPDDNQRPSLTYIRNLVIYYNMMYQSKIEFIKKPVYFEKNGYYDPSAIMWEGEMSRQRIADWLPLEYSVK